MTPEWAALSPSQQEARCKAQEAAAVEEHRLWWAGQTAETALRIAGGGKAAAIGLLRLAIGELELPAPDEKGGGQ